MICSAKNFTGKLTDKQIQDASEKYGYENFIPYGLVRDLFNVWTQVIFGNIPNTAIIVENDYDKAFIKLISYIHVNKIKQTLGTEFAFNILKQYGSKLNLRKIEEARITGDTFEFEEGEQYNYNFNLNEVSSNILHILSLSFDKPLNEINLSDEIKDILKYYTGIQSFLGILEDSPILKREQMKHYHQIVKVPKRRLVYPTFKYDYTTKKLPVKIPIVEKKDKDTLTLLIDISSSVFIDSKYILLYKGILLYFIDNFKDNINTLKIYYFAYNVVEYLEIKSVQELTNLFFTPLKPAHGMRGWTQSIIRFKKVLNSETIILMTDGSKDAEALDFTNNNNYHVISLKENKVLKSLANITNGKFIKI